MSPNSRDNEALTHLADLGLNQVIDVATHREGNNLDLVFLNWENLSFKVSQSLFSDHLPVVFHTQVSISKEPISCAKNYSKSSFKPAIVNEILTFLYDMLSANLPLIEFSFYGMIIFSMPCHCPVRSNGRNVHLFPFLIHPIVCIQSTKGELYFKSCPKVGHFRSH